jgi:glutaredoxin 3
MSTVKVEIYTKDFCPYCIRAKELLHNKGVDFIEYTVGDDPVKRATLREKSRGSSTVPQIFIDGEHIGGCDDLYALDRSGKLDEMLKIAV